MALRRRIERRAMIGVVVLLRAATHAGARGAAPEDRPAGAVVPVVLTDPMTKEAARDLVVTSSPDRRSGSTRRAERRRLDPKIRGTRMPALSATWLCIVFCASLMGCSPGPRQLEQGHLAYNASVKASVDDELLLNIVRLRYLDTVEFLAANSISSQTSYTVSLGGQLGRQDLGPGVGTTALFLPQIEYSDRPTVTFIPQRGREFANSLTKPIGVRTLTYLAATNWDVYFLLRIFVREMNGLLNEIGNTEPAFVETVRALGALQLQDALIFGFRDVDVPLSGPITASQISGADLVTAAQAGYRFEQAPANDAYVLTSTRSQPVLYIRPGRGNSKPIINALGLKDDGRPYFQLEPDDVPETEIEAGAAINLRIRSLFDAIIYVTQGVEVPEAHIEQGLATRDWPPGFDLQSIDDLLRIRASVEKPGVNWQVRYRGYWYYIDEADDTSKLTFLLLAELFRLGLVDTGAGQAPVLTLPVGGP